MHLPLVRILDGMMTKRGQCWEPGVGFCAQVGACFPHLPGQWCFCSLGFPSLPFPAGPPAPSSFPEAPSVVAASGLGDCRGDDAKAVPFLRGRADTSPGVLLSVIPPLWPLLFLVQTLPVGTHNLLGQGNCIRDCATPRAGGAPGSCPDLRISVTHKHPKDRTASCS